MLIIERSVKEIKSCEKVAHKKPPGERKNTPETGFGIARPNDV